MERIAQAPQVAGVLVGDIHRDPGARTKYGLFFEALGQRLPLVSVYDAGLHGLERILNAIRVIHPDRQRWRERFYKNVPAFQARSRRAAAWLRSLQGQVDVVLQVGVLFNGRGDGAGPPSVIYTDYTARLSARHPSGGRSPFTPAQRAAWISLESRTLEQAAYVCTRGESVRQSLLADYGLPPERVTAIGGGVNFPVLPEVAGRDPAAPPTALFIGKELYRKGGDRVLRAFARARAHRPDARLLLVTGDTIPVGLPLDGVQVVRPTWNRAAVAALYAQADVFVLASRLETWGDVLLEAMAYGLPCVGVAGQTMDEIIHHERTGLIVPPDDEAALADALARLFRDPGQRQAWGRAGRRLVETTFTWERVVDRVVPILQAAVQVPVLE